MAATALQTATSWLVVPHNSTPRARGPWMGAKTASRTKRVASKGFGTSLKPKKRAPEVPLPPEVASAIQELFAADDQSIERYLNPKHLEDPATMEEIARKLQSGDVVVLRDAFRPEFAEMVFQELSAKSVAWDLNEAYFPDGYGHRHHNVYDKSSWSARLNATQAVFADAKTQAFMGELTGRDCSGVTVGAPSWYQEGDHSLPHTDWVGQRTVAYVWHLSKNWKPEWGGALYWARHDHAVATYPASFNTLVLFGVTTTSAHFVTTVSPHHKGKRLTFNGWWQSSWEPTVEDDVEGRLASADARSKVTHTQLQGITDLANDEWQNIADERRAALRNLSADIMKEFFPHGARAGIEA